MKMLLSYSYIYRFCFISYCTCYRSFCFIRVADIRWYQCNIEAGCSSYWYSCYCRYNYEYSCVIKTHFCLICCCCCFTFDLHICFFGYWYLFIDICCLYNSSSYVYFFCFLFSLIDCWYFCDTCCYFCIYICRFLRYYMYFTIFNIENYT